MNAIRSMVWTIITSLLGSRENYKVGHIEDRDAVERHFMNDIQNNKIGWDANFDLENTDRFGQACHLNNIEAAVFVMNHKDLDTNTKCDGLLYEQRTHPTEFIVLQFDHVNYEDKLKVYRHY